MYMKFKYMYIVLGPTSKKDIGSRNIYMKFEYTYLVLSPTSRVVHIRLRVDYETFYTKYKRYIELCMT